MNLTKKQFSQLFEEQGFNVQKTMPVENMPLLYKFKFFRHYNHKNFNEKKEREEGYLLSQVGRIIQMLLIFSQVSFAISM